MAVPTIRSKFIPAATGSGDISNWMPELHALLVAAGWTLEYANADAIGSGDAGDPAWDNAPVSNQIAGVVVYQMPNNDHDTAWYVKIRPAWASGSLYPYIYEVTAGETHDGNGNVGAGTIALRSGTTGGDTQNAQALLAASEDGFIAILRPNDITGAVAWVERPRRSSATTQDGIMALVKYSGATLAAEIVIPEVGAVSDKMMLLTTARIGGTEDGGSTLSADGTERVPMGPYFPGGDPLFLPPRLAFIASAGDVANGALVTRIIDGAARPYRAAAGVMGNAYGIWCVAEEE